MLLAAWADTAFADPAEPDNAAQTQMGQISSIKPLSPGLALSSSLSLATADAYAPIHNGSDAHDSAELSLFVGESRVFPTPGVARIAVGNGSLMTAAALDGREVILFANAPGATTLFVWNADGRSQRVRVNISPGDTTRIARELAAFLASIPNAHTSIIGDRIIIEGEDLSDHDLARIDALSKSYPQVVNFTSSLGWEQMVLLDVKIVEFPVNQLKELGLAWTPAGGIAFGGIWSPFRRGNDGPYQINIPAGQNGPPISNPNDNEPVLLSSSLNILSGINLGLNAQLNALAQEGKASILSEPQLSARNGSEAKFLAGGELPYTVSTINGPTVLFKPYGIRLSILPRVSRSGTIRATIDSEVSSIDNSVSTPSGPALLSRQTQTEFNVRGGETIVLSGLISREQSRDVDKLPLLGDIPIIGALFRSKRFRNRETELVVFVTPRVIDSATPDLVDRIARTQDRLHRSFGKPPDLTNALQSFGAPDTQTESTDSDSATSAAAPGVQDPAPLPALEDDPTAEPAVPETPDSEVAFRAVATLPETPVENPLGYRVTTASLALLAWPHADGYRIRGLPEGSRVVGTLRGPTTQGWLHVLYHDGETLQEGWVDPQGLVAEAGRSR